MLKYWGRLLHMEDGRIAKQVYRHCKNANASLNGTWSYSIKKLLSELNLAHLWESEEIGALKDWTTLAVACVKKNELACWKGQMWLKPKLRFYRLLKTSLKREEYLSWEIPEECRRIVTQMRCGTHPLQVEVGRWSGRPLEERLCRVCITGQIEDELHFLCQCYVYDSLRGSTGRFRFKLVTT